jgi:hypothetical protein
MSKKGDDGPPRLSGVNYGMVMDRQVGDKRFEREKQHSNVEAKPKSSTFDAFQRLAAGLDSRTIADKIADPNRITWEQYKQENEDKLDIAGNDVRRLIEYRVQLDKERDKLLRKAGGKHKGPADSDDESENDPEKVSKSKKSSKKRAKSELDSNESETNQLQDNSSTDEDRHKSKKHRKEKKSQKKSKKEKKQKKHSKHKNKKKKEKESSSVSSSASSSSSESEEK